MPSTKAASGQAVLAAQPVGTLAGNETATQVRLVVSDPGRALLDPDHHAALVTATATAGAGEVQVCGHVLRLARPLDAKLWQLILSLTPEELAPAPGDAPGPLPSVAERHTSDTQDVCHGADECLQVPFALVATTPPATSGALVPSPCAGSGWCPRRSA
jgi:hypothetical protein